MFVSAQAGRRHSSSLLLLHSGAVPARRRTWPDHVTAVREGKREGIEGKYQQRTLSVDPLCPPKAELRVFGGCRTQCTASEVAALSRLPGEIRDGAQVATRLGTDWAAPRFSRQATDGFLFTTQGRTRAALGGSSPRESSNFAEGRGGEGRPRVQERLERLASSEHAGASGEALGHEERVQLLVAKGRESDGLDQDAAEWSR